MSRWFPSGFLEGFLTERKVSCFLGADSHPEFRKLLVKPIDSVGRQWFPTTATVVTIGNPWFPGGFLEGFLYRDHPKMKSLLRAFSV